MKVFIYHEYIFLLNNILLGTAVTR